MARTDRVDKAQLVAKFLRIAKQHGVVISQDHLKVMERAFSNIDNWATFVWVSKDLVYKLNTYCEVQIELAKKIIQEMYSHIPNE